MNRMRKPGPGMLLVAAMDARRDVEVGDELATSRHVDAFVVALVRAAVTHGIRLVVPLEPRFAPLVADIVSEYASPREAEGSDADPRTFEDGDAHAMLGFVTFGGEQAGKGPGALLSAMRPFQQLGMVARTVDPVSVAADKYSLRSAVLVGSGGFVAQAMRNDTVLNLPRQRFLAPASNRTRRQQGQADGIVERMDRELAAAKQRIEHFQPRMGDAPSIRESDGEVPIDFWRFPAYTMYADQVVRQIRESDFR